MDQTNYLEQQYLSEEIRPISEGIADAIKKFSLNKIKGVAEKLKDAAQKKDMKKFETLRKLIPEAPIGEIEAVAGKKISGYSQRKAAAVKSLKKTKIPLKIRNHVASFVAVISKDVENTQKAIEQVGSSVDWSIVGHRVAVRLIISLLFITIAAIKTGVITMPLLAFYLALNLIFLIYDIIFVRVEKYEIT